jgi:hypothetical protein
MPVIETGAWPLCEGRSLDVTELGDGLSFVPSNGAFVAVEV